MTKARFCSLFLLLLIVLSSLSQSVFQSTWSQDESSKKVIATFTPNSTTSNVDVEDTTLLSIPANHTFIEGAMEVEPIPVPYDYDSTTYGLLSNTSWNGTFTNLEISNSTGELRLGVKEIRGTSTDFESLTLQPDGWFSVGQNHSVWEVVDLANTSFASLMSKPNSGTHGKYAISTTAFGNLSSSAYSCIQSPTISTPNMYRNYTIEFDSWLSLFDTDAMWIEFRNRTTWEVVTPTSGYGNATNNLLQSPSMAFSGQSTGWQRQVVVLDGYLQGTVPNFQFRFCFETSSDVGQRGGIFIDNVTLNNEGDLRGAWIHGNLTGDYAPNAYGIMYLQANLSGLSGPLELEFWANWDIEGASSDELSTWYSVDNGSSWQVISPIPGLPGWGFIYQGVTYRMESYGWIPIRYGLPTNLSSHQNASEILLSFQVNTDAVKNYGGSFSESWEGMVIDDVSIWAGRNSPNPTRRMLSNFSTQSTQGFGDPSGWKNTSSSLVNEWQWTNTLGNNGPTSRQFSFENPIVAPAGWSILSDGKTGWEIGNTANTSGYGPGQFSSGSNGAAINLVTRYTNNLYTHLITPEFEVPVNASARIQFQSWMCAEANWDGGTVSISTDGGQTWWYIPDKIPEFHDQISSVNPYSPHYMLGIIDGSNVAGGNCIQNRPSQFTTKSFDMNNVSGQNIRARFSFFSDQYLEYDGWYIDDIDFQIEVFEQSGQWLSPSITPDSMYGYGILDGWVTMPDGTDVTVTLLDHQYNVIDEYESRSLPLPIHIDTSQYPSIHVQLNFSTEDEYMTPTIHSLHLGSEHFIQAKDLSSLVGLISDHQVFISSQQQFLDIERFSICPYSSVNIKSYGWNASWSNSLMVNASWWDNQDIDGQRQYNFTTPVGMTEFDFRLSLMTGQEFNRAIIRPQCMLYPNNISIAFKDTSHEIFAWPPSTFESALGLSQKFNVSNQGTFISSTQSLELSPTLGQSISYILPYSALPNSHNQNGYLHLSTNFTSSATLNLSDGQSFLLPIGRHSLYVGLQQRCPSPLTFLASNLSLQSCTLTLNASSQGSVKINQFMHFDEHSKFHIPLTHEVLEQAKLAAYQGGNYEIIPIPISFQSSGAGLMINVTSDQRPMFIEAVESTSIEQWLPQREIEVTTRHERSNPAQPTFDAPDITSIQLSLGSSASYESIFVVVEVDQLSGTPRFRQHSGLGLAALQTSSVNCGLNACEVTWRFKSSWLLDDVDDVHYFLKATDINGMFAGPTLHFINTQSNQIENDVEIVQLGILDDQQRPIGDWTHPLWPFHVSQSTTMEVTGRVRFDGTSNIWVGSNEAEVTIQIQAVPPINASGGQPEWPGEAVDYIQSWTGEVDDTGRFSVTIESPSSTENIPSNTWMSIRAFISRCGPANQTSTTSLDRTQSVSAIRFLHDTSPPDFIGLDVLDQSGRVPLDGHIWMEGQNIPIRLFLSDKEGLAPTIEVKTWLEHRDDENGNGLMEMDEYQSLWVSVNKGVKNAEIDLPLFEWNDILPPDEQVGRASLVVNAYDLAGNRISNGGTEGEFTDAATFEVQRRSDTLVDLDDFSFDLVEQHLLPGYQHSFNVVLTEGNGLTSLDSIRLHLMSGEFSQSCFIHYFPRFHTVEFDEGCFEETPTVSTNQRTPSSTFDVVFSFRLSWQRVSILPNLSYLPSFSVYDEGSSIPIGFSTMERYRWTAEKVLELRIDSIVDQTIPQGAEYDGVLSLSKEDLVEATIGVYYNSSSIVAEELPRDGALQWRLEDGERVRTGNINFSSYGRYTLLITIESLVMVNDEGILSFSISGMNEWITNTLEMPLHIDDQKPRGVLPQGVFENLRSNALEDVELIFVVEDDGGIGAHNTMMYAQLFRAGKPVEGMNKSFVLVGEMTGMTRTTFEGRLNLSFTDFKYERGDSFEIWFSVVDNAGYAMTGLGSQEQPYRFGITLVAFEPAFQDIIVEPYRAKVGQELSISIDVVNPGLLSGSTRLLLRNDEGKILNSTELLLESGATKRIEWTVEAWKEGRLGLTIELENRTPRISIPMAAVEPFEVEDGTSAMVNAGLSILGIVVLVFVFIIRRNQKVERWFDHIDFDHQKSPPKLQKIVDAHEEQ
jgi:hypothetical protein